MKRLTPVLIAALGFYVFVVYCWAASLPLHMGPDQLAYFSEATHVIRGEPIDVGDQHQLGYSYALVGLHLIGLDSIHGVVGFNIVALAIGCACSWYLLRRDFVLPPVETACALLLTLVMGPCFNLVTCALSDMCYFATSLLALVCLHRFVASGSWKAVLGGLLFTAASIELRMVGLALIAAVVTSLCLRFRQHIKGWMVASTGAVTALVLAVVCWNAQYSGAGFGQYTRAYGSVTNAVVTLTEIRLRVLGEMVTHFSIYRVPPVYREEFTLLGIVICIVLAVGAWTFRRHLTPLTAYIAFYSAVTLVWPYIDDRFWLGVMPFLFAVLLVGLKEIGARTPRAAKIAKPLLLAYVCVIAVWWHLWCVNYLAFHDPRADKAIAELRESQ
jgi:hypothetical protein